MKIQYINPTPYTIGNKYFAKGDIIEDTDNLLKQFPQFFAIVAEVDVHAMKKDALKNMSLTDLQKFAKQHSIAISRDWKKKELLDNIMKILNE